MYDERERTSTLRSVAVGLLLVVAAVGLLLVSAWPWLGVVLIAILGVAPFGGICLWSAYAASAERGVQGGTAPQVLVWAERAVLSLVVLGVAALVVWAGRGGDSGATSVCLALLGAGVVLGALLGSFPRALLAVEGAMCAAYVVWCGWILSTSAACSDCEVGGGIFGLDGFTILGLIILSFWLITLLGGVTVGAILRRLLR